MIESNRGAVFLRATLGVVVVADLLSLYLFISEARADALAGGVPLTPFHDLLSRTAVKGGIVLIGTAAAAAFARRPGRLWEGMLALGTLILLSTVHAELYGSPWRHLFFSGVCLSGWLLGLAVSRGRGAPTDESYARTGSIALLGATYLNSGISKIAYGGLDWISGLPIRVIIVGQDGLVADSLLGAYRSWVASAPAVAGFFSVATVGFELAGPLMIAGKTARRCVALGLIVMHANIYALTDILYWESMVLLAVFGLSADGPSPEPVADTSHRAYERLFAVAAGLLALGAILAVIHQARRYMHARDSSAQVRDRGPAAPTAAALRQVGPFTVGQTLAEEWSVDSFSLSDDGFVVALSGRPGRARFELTCSASAHRSPFDLGAAHIFYSSDVEFGDLEAVGRAMQEQVRNTAGGQDVCERLASWRSAVQAAQSH